MSHVLTDEEIKELFERAVPKQWFLFGENSDKNKKLKNMSANEIKYLLEKHEFVKYYDNEDEVTYYKELAPFYKEFDNYFEFIGYPYTEKEPIEYDYAFEIYVDKNNGEIFEATAPISSVELRKREKEIGLNRIKPYEDTVKTIEDARNILEKSKLILGEKRSGKKHKGIIYYYKLGDFYCEYEYNFSFIGYPYTSKDKEINYKNKNELLVEKWRGNIGIVTGYSSIDKENGIIKADIEYIDPEYDSIRYCGVDELKIIKKEIYPVYLL